MNPTLRRIKYGIGVNSGANLVKIFHVYKFFYKKE